MKTSTKILILLTLLFFIPTAFLFRYVISSVVPTENGFKVVFSTFGWLGLVSLLCFLMFFLILFFKFLNKQKLSYALFFSILPLTILYGGAVVYFSSANYGENDFAKATRATFSIAENNQSNKFVLLILLASLIYLVLIFFTIIFLCKPLNRVENITQRLGDGRVKYDNFKIGGGKQFKEIEYSLNKINYNYKEKNNLLKYTNFEKQKEIPKQLLKILGKKNVEDLEMGREIKKKLALMFCCLNDIKHEDKNVDIKEKSFSKTAYYKSISSFVKRQKGAVDKYWGNSILAVFPSVKDALQCANEISKSRNKKKDKTLSNVSSSIDCQEVVFGLIEQDGKKIPTITSDVYNSLNKIEEINAFIGTKVLITKFALNALPQNFDFSYRFVGNLTLDSEEISLYESLNYYSKAKRDKLLKLKNKFEEGVIFYSEKQMSKAKANFEEILRVMPDDKPSFVYFNKSCKKTKKQ